VLFHPKFCAGGNADNVHNIHVLPLTNDGFTLNHGNRLPDTLPVNAIIFTLPLVSPYELLSIQSKSVILIVNVSLTTLVVAVLVLPSASTMFTIKLPVLAPVVKVLLAILVHVGAVFIEYVNGHVQGAFLSITVFRL